MKITIVVDTPQEWEKVSKLITELGLRSGDVGLQIESSPGSEKPADQASISTRENLVPIPYLVGERIYLAPFTRQHLESPRYQRWLNDLEITSSLGMLEYLMPVSFEQLESYYSRNAFSGHSVFFALHERETDEFVGTAKVGHINRLSRCAEFGRVIGEKDARGKGYGTEIIELILDYCFRTLNLNKVVAGTHAGNIAALKTYEKFGFKIEGTIRQAWYKDGELVDTIRVGLLREEWEARRKPD